MTKSDQTSIIDRVKWIQNNSRKIDAIHIKKEKLEKEESKLFEENMTSVDCIKKTMGNINTVNAKIDDRYISITQKTVGVSIDEFFIHIDLK